MVRSVITALVFIIMSGYAFAASLMEVKAAQALLNVLGYDVGTADGVLGPGTQQAVRRFLQQRKLDPNAKIDEELLNALVAAIIENPPIPEGRVNLHSAKVDLQSENFSESRFRDRARLSIRFSNETDKTVVGVEYKFIIKNDSGKVLYQDGDQMEVRIGTKKVSSGGLFYYWTDNQSIYG